MEETGNDNAHQTEGISKEMSQVNDFAIELKEVLNTIEECLNRLESNNTAVIGIASQTNLLAEDSKTTADDSNANNRDVKETVEHLMEEAAKLSEIVNSVNGRTTSLVASAEETAVSISLMKDMAENVESSLREILEH